MIHEIGSPEQVIGHVIDGRSDLFSLGIILYELLTGEKPFMGSSLTTITYQVVNVDPIEPSKIRPGIPKIFDQLVARLLKKAPDERFQTGKEVAEALRSVRDGGASAMLGGTQAGTRGMAIGAGDATQVSRPSALGGGTIGSSATLTSSPGSNSAAASGPESESGKKSSSGRVLVAIAAGVIVLLSAVMLMKLLAGKDAQVAPGAGDGLTTGAVAVVGASGATAAVGASGTAMPSAASGPGGAAAPSGVSTTAAVTASAPHGPSGGINLPPRTPSRAAQTTAGSSGTPFVLPPRATGASTATSSAAAQAAAATGSATVNLTLTHKLKSGTLVVTLDGKPVLTLDLSSPDRKRGKDTATGTFAAADGRHEIRLCLTSPEIEDGAKCAYKQVAFVMNRSVTLRAEHGKPTVGTHWLTFQVE